MPTGYTAAVQDGKITKLADFALSCARAFGALITMRDEPFDAPIPDEIKPSSHCAERAKEAQERIAKLDEMTPAAAQAALENEIKAHTSRKKKWAAEKAAQLARYNAMLVQVEAWHPPTAEHTELKDFMLNQLRDSIRGDCGGEYWEPKLPVTATEWVKAERAKAERDHSYYTAEDAKERERAAKRTAWVRDLKDSLK